MIQFALLSALALSSATNNASLQKEQLGHIANFGKYQAVLRVPEEGLYAGEEIDVEFRVVDTTQKDAVENGFKGVGGITATAKLTMPSMPGMPSASPKVHREGVPGDYGIELFFPHGGDYRIDLDLKIPNAGTYKISFLVDVKDERPSNSVKAKPYKLEVVDWPTTAEAGKPVELKLKVVESKSGDVVKTFDIAHEKYFHLLLTSKDLNWFLHEHPEMDENVVWTIPVTFPAAGSYWVHGDVAPKDKGSQLLTTKVSVTGKPQEWSSKHELSNTSVVGKMKGLLSTLKPIEIGKKTTLQVKLFNTDNGMPIGDTVPWLGAAGHMMIFHTDGVTVVHSHPAEDEENNALVKKGIVRFTGRFPKEGFYKVYAQFDWDGEIRTLSFGIQVKGASK